MSIVRRHYARMPKWLQGMVGPTLTLWLYAAVHGVAAALSPDSPELPGRAKLVSTVALPLIVALWVVADARKRGRQLCYDFDSFSYFAWPFVVPFYLFQTRGVRALITLLCFAATWLIAVLTAAVVFLIREFVSS